jgi:SnoaL-like polyketide cyclase
MDTSVDGVTVRNHITATHTGEFLGIPPTGRRFERDHVAIVKIKDDASSANGPSQTFGVSTHSWLDPTAQLTRAALTPPDG